MDGSEQSFQIFDELELQGGGYTWEGIIRSLINSKMPGDAESLDVGAEADNAYVYSTSEPALAALRELIINVDQDSVALREAISNADENLE